MGQILWWIKQDETMQIYDDFEGFGANFCIVWVGNITTPGFSPNSHGLKTAMDCRSFGFEDPERARPLVGCSNCFQVDFKLNLFNMFLITYATCSMITLINFYQLVWAISTYINLLTLKSSAHVAWLSTARWNCYPTTRLRRLPDEAAGRREAPGSSVWWQTEKPSESNLLGYLFGEFLLGLFFFRLPPLVTTPTPRKIGPALFIEYIMNPSWKKKT